MDPRPLEAYQQVIPIQLLMFAGALIAFLAGERVIRAMFRRNILSTRQTYYSLAGLQGVCFGLAVVVSLAISTNLPRSLLALFALVLLSLFLASVCSMVLLAHLVVRFRRIDIDEFIARKYG
jgi:hypothetical protein